MKQDNTYFFPWVRKGIGSKIIEKDTLGTFEDGTAYTMQRPMVQVTAKMNATSVATDEDGKAKVIPMSESKDITIVGPGDIQAVNSNAIIRTRPASGEEGFPVNCYPYAEFWEPDFAWRFSPAAADGDKLRPWLAVIVCESARCSIEKTKNGGTIVTLNLDENSYAQTFPSPRDIWKAAHAQGTTPDEADFCRIIALRASEELETDTEYYAFVVPTFETGRLSGLGYDDKLKETIAQTPAWEDSLEGQKQNHVEPLRFPAYITWKFKTGGYGFDNLVSKLEPYTAKKGGIAVDVTTMGEGLDYATLRKDAPSKTGINMPAATKLPGSEAEKAFPSSTGDEAKLQKNLKTLLSMNPVFEENIYETSTEAGSKKEDNDDPWVVPPIYGAKHVMATSLDEKDNKDAKKGIDNTWMLQTNLDIHYRAAAGLGKKAVQRHQEEFVNRAWKQIEVVQTLNRELYKAIASIRVNESLKGNRYPWLTDKSGAKYVSNLMMNLSSMRNTTTDDGTSLSSILSDSNIPNSFASASFHKMTDQLASHIKGLDTATVLEKIAENQIFKQSDPKYSDLPTVGLMRNTVNNVYDNIVDLLINAMLGKYINIAKRSDSTTDFYYQFKTVSTDNSVSRNAFVTNILQYYITYMLGAVQPTDKFKKLDELFTNGLDRITCGGYKLDKELLDGKVDNESESYRIFSCNYKIGLYDMIGLDSSIYESMFGNKNIISKLQGNNNSRYFFSIQGLVDACVKDSALRDKVRILKKCQYSYGNNSTEAGSHTYSISGINTVNIAGTNHYCLYKNDGSINIPSAIQIIHSYPKRESSGSFVPGGITHRGTAVKDAFYDPNAWNVSNNVTINDLQDWKNAPADKQQLYRQLSEKATKFIFETPDLILADMDAIDSKYIKVYDSPVAFAQSLKELDEKTLHPAFACWKSLKSVVDQLPVVSSSNGSYTKSNLADTSKIQERLLDEESYERIEEVVTTYWSAFLSDKELQDKYIDSLLMSRYPVMAYPQFPEPSYYYLKGMSDKFILPAVDELPDNSVSMFESDGAFVEAYLSGMNTEMGRELLWREYPTDQRGSYFKKFWDSDNSVEDIRKDNFFDVKDLHTWKGKLGDNHVDGKQGLLIFAVKGDLMRQYPDTMVYLQHVTASGTGKDMKLGLEKDKKGNDAGIILPVAQAFLREDIYIVGFRTDVATALGNPEKNDYGYMLVFKQRVENLDFMRDDTDEVQVSALEAAADSANIADALIDQPTVYGRHVLSFIPKA